PNNEQTYASHMSRFDKPSETVMFADSERLAADGTPLHSYQNRFSLLPDTTEAGTSGKPKLFGRHLDTVNSLFVDGHVKAMKKNELLKIVDNTTNPRNCFKDTRAFGTNHCASMFYYFQVSANASTYY